MSEPLYQAASSIDTNLLQKAREQELSGETNQQTYRDAALSLDKQLFTRYELPDFAVRKEILAKHQIAQGHITTIEEGKQLEELSREGYNGNAAKHFSRASELYGKIRDKLSADKPEAAYARKAQRSIAKILGRPQEKIPEGSIDEILEHMPAQIARELQPGKYGFFDTYVNYAPEDAKYAETQDYNVAISMWEKHTWSDRGGGIEWKNWVTVYFSKKGNDQLHSLRTKEITTRHQSTPRLDKDHLWRFDEAGFEVGEGNKITVFWADGEDRGPSYELDLDEILKEEQS